MTIDYIIILRPKRVIYSESFDPTVEHESLCTLQQLLLYMIYKIINIFNRSIFFLRRLFAVYYFNSLNLFRILIRI